MTGKRQANFELLRIVAMLMIITLHYLGKGGILGEFPFVPGENPARVLGWLVEAFCIVAVNCYVLISGYFCVESVWKPGRVVSLLCQVLFYSLSIPCLFLLFGANSAQESGFYYWREFVLPIESEHYWFATAYMIMYLFVPFLAAGVRQMEKRQFQIAIALLLCFFSLGKTVFPVYLETDIFGYDFGWFLCLFLIGGYIGKYGIAWLEKQSHAVGVYFLSGVWIWLLAFACNGLCGKGEDYGYYEVFSYYTVKLYSYNHLLCLVGAVALFYVFKNLRMEEGRFADLLRRFAPYTFGVYLLHEHKLVRYEWMKWLGVERVKGSFWFVPHMIGCVLLVYVIGTAADAAWAWLFARAAALITTKRKNI